MPNNLDLDAIKRRAVNCCFMQTSSACAEPWTIDELLQIKSYPKETIMAVVAILNAAPALMAEVERLRQRVNDLLESNNEFEQQARDARIATGKFKLLLECAQDGWSDALDKRNEGLEKIERLRQELATAKKIGAAEWHEERAADCRALNGEMCREARQHEHIAAELRAEVGG